MVGRKNGPERKRLSQKVEVQPQQNDPSAQQVDNQTGLTRRQAIKLLLGGAGVLAVGGYIISQDEKEKQEKSPGTTTLTPAPKPKPLLTPEQQTDKMIAQIEEGFAKRKKDVEAKLHLLPESMQAEIMMPFVLMEHNQNNPYRNYHKLLKAGSSSKFTLSDIKYFAINVADIENETIATGFSPVARTIVIEPDFNIKDDSDFLTLYHELFHALEDVETRNKLSLDQYNQFFSQSDVFMVDEEAIAHAREIEVLNLILDNQVYNSLGGGMIDASSLNIDPNNDHNIRILIEMAQLYYPTRDPKTLYQFLADRHHQLGYQLWVKDGKSGFKPYSR